MSSVSQDDAKTVYFMGGYKVKLIRLSYAVRFKLLRHCIFSAGVGEADEPQKTRVSMFVGTIVEKPVTLWTICVDEYGSRYILLCHKVYFSSLAPLVSEIQTKS